MTSNAYLDLYDNVRESLYAHSAPLMNACRGEAYEALGKLGLREFADEYSKDLGINVMRHKSPVDPYKLFACDVPGIGAYVYYVLNDMFYPNPGQESLPEGVIICSLKEAAEKMPGVVSRYYGRQTAYDDGSYALNMLFAQDGLFVYVPKGVKLERPVQLINLMYAGDDMLALSHNLIIIEDDAAVQLMVCDHAHGDPFYFANRITEVHVGRNAVYEHVKLESSKENICNVCTLLLSLSEGSDVVSDIITLRGGKTRNTVRAYINGPHANMSLNGLAVCDKSQCCDNTTYIEHAAGGSSSNQLFKYILDGSSRGNFYGLVKVDEGAQKTSALQTNRNLCLSPDAVMRTLPQLEIYADDVKCNHGATIGQMDEAALFYLRSRGISSQEARMLLMFAFVKDVLDNIRIPVLRERLEMLIEKRLRGKESDCSACGAGCHSNRLY